MANKQVDIYHQVEEYGKIRTIEFSITDFNLLKAIQKQVEELGW